MARVPIILGTGISGLAISRHLSNKNIDHILLGPEPHSFPRLGESLDYTATVELDRYFADLSNCYYSKTSVDFFTQSSQFHCSTRINRFFPIVPTFFWKVLGVAAPTRFHHIDRIKFEKVLFAKEIERKTCQYIDSIVTKIDYDEQEDRVERVHCKNGDIVEASYVFDTTGVRGAVTSTVPNHCNLLSDTQQTAFGHFESNGAFCSSDKWQHATGVFQLYQNIDGIDAVGWIINCGEILSVGVSTSARTGGISAEQLFDYAYKHLTKRGFELNECQKRVEPKLFKHRYYKMNRLYGSNWVLAGGSAAGYWFPTGSGVGIGLLVARLAPEIIKDSKYLKNYERYVEKLITSHKSIAKLLETSQSGHCSTDDERSLLKSVLNGNISRSAEYYLAVGAKWQYSILSFIYNLSKKNIIFNKICRHVRALKLDV